MAAITGKTIESGVQLFSRITQGPNLNGINPILIESGPKPNGIIEIVGELQYDLLLDFIIRCILPKELDESWKGSGAVFINTDYHINVLKIARVLDAHLRKNNVKSRKKIIENALSNLIIYNCYNSEQIEITIHSLERLIHKRDNVGLVVIDNIAAQYWASKNNKPISFDHFAKKRFDYLYNFIKNLNVVLIFGRDQVSDYKRRLSLNVNHKIIVEKKTLEEYQATVINFDEETQKVINFNFIPCVSQIRIIVFDESIVKAESPSSSCTQ